MLDGGRKSQCRLKRKTSPKPICRMKQRMGGRFRLGLSVSRQPFHCEICQVSVNSETQLKQVNTSSNNEKDNILSVVSGTLHVSMSTFSTSTAEGIESVWLGNLFE